jgi:NDP-sugar pyrophosphorylase family protein
MNVAILAGGLATRLGELSKDTPKALLDVAGEPFIFHQLRALHSAGLENIVICAGFLGEKIVARVGDGKNLGLSVKYSFDWPELLGTGGAIRKALPLLGETFMVIYGDSYLNVNYNHVYEIFKVSNKKGLMTIFRNEGLYDVSNVVFENGTILYDKFNITDKMKYIDYGLGCLKSETIDTWPAKKFDLAEVYMDLSQKGQLMGYEVFERFYEIGSFEGLAELKAFLKKG